MRKYFYLSTLLLIFVFTIAIIATVPITVQAIGEVTPTPSADEPEPIEVSPTPVPPEPTAVPDDVDIDALIDEAIVDIQEGRFRAAIAKMDTVLELDPNHVNAYFLRGASYMRLSQYDNAIDDFTAAIDLQPWDIDFYIWRGDAYNLQGELVDALLDYELALEIDPTEINVFARRSEVYYQLGDNSAGDTDDLIVRGLEAAVSGEILPALDFLTEAVNSADSDAAKASAYYARGMIYFTRDPEAAIEDFTLAAEADPDLDNAYLVLGIMYREGGDMEAAGPEFYKRIITNGRETIELDAEIGDVLEIEMAYRRVYAISFEGEAGQVVNITARDSEFTIIDPLIALVAPDGEAIAGDDDFGGELDSLIDDFELPQDGTYTLYVGHAEGGYSFGFQGIVHIDIDG